MKSALIKTALNKVLNFDHHEIDHRSFFLRHCSKSNCFRFERLQEKKRTATDLCSFISLDLNVIRVKWRKKNYLSDTEIPHSVSRYLVRFFLYDTVIVDSSLLLRKWKHKKPFRTSKWKCKRQKKNVYECDRYFSSWHTHKKKSTWNRIIHKKRNVYTIFVLHCELVGSFGALL